MITALHLAADALALEAIADKRLAEEYDAAQARGEVAKRGEQDRVRDNLPNGKVIATADDLGLSYKQIHEARRVRDPIATKRALGHGNFLAWIEAEFGMSDKSAERFMRCASRLGSKFDTVSNLDLGASILYELAAPSTSGEIIDVVVEKAQAGERVTRDDVKALKAEFAAEKKARESGARSDPQPGRDAFRPTSGPDRAPTPTSRAPHNILWPRPRRGPLIGARPARWSVAVSNHWLARFFPAGSVSIRSRRFSARRCVRC